MKQITHIELHHACPSYLLDEISNAYLARRLNKGDNDGVFMDEHKPVLTIQQHTVEKHQTMMMNFNDKFPHSEMKAIGELFVAAMVGKEPTAIVVTPFGVTSTVVDKPKEG